MAFRFFRLVLLFCWICLCGKAGAQRTLLLQASPDEHEALQSALDGWSGASGAHRQDSVWRFDGLAETPDSFARRLIGRFHERAHYLASVDSFINDSTARLYLGPVFTWVSLRTGPELTARRLDAAGLRLRNLNGKPLQYEGLQRAKEQLLADAENNGYPFARVWLDSVALASGGGVSAVLRLQNNTPVVFGAVKAMGDLRLPKGFLAQYLGMRAGTPYDRSKIEAAAGRLRQVPFLESAGSPIVRFEGERADVRLPLRRKRAGRFDFVIGLLPQPNDPDGRLLLTGNLSAAFQNALGWGERLALEFERLKPETQKLDAAAAVPYVLGTPFGVDGRLNIFRRDSSWVDAQSKVGVQYLFAVGNSVGFFWDNRSLFLQTIDTAAIIQTRRLPSYLDLRQNGFGMEAQWQALDYRLNPRRGWAAFVQGVAGFSNVRRNSAIENLSDPDDPEFDFGALYDSIPEKSTRYRLSANLETFWPLFRRSALKTAVRAQGIFSKDPVYNNEQFRLGGNKLLRGFNEESLFATRYAVGTLEYRLLIGTNAYLAAFADYGYLENLTDRLRLFQRPLGLGAGIVFESQAGLFGVSGAVGRIDNGQPFDLRAVKVHLGYVNLF